MPYTAAQLITFYTNVHAGLAPTAAQTVTLNSFAAQNNAGTLTDVQTLQSVIDTADADSAVAIGSYEFFTGTAPTAAGLAFLVNSTTNPNDLNDPYYQNFNQTNRFINFAANLGTGAGAGAAAFKTAYGALTTSQTVDIAYETIVGTANAQAAGIDVTAAKAYINSQLPYFTALANQNAPAGATAADKDLLIKAEIVGYILSAAVQANIGTYSNAISALLADLAPDNTANLGVDLLGNYAANAVTLTVFPDTKVANVFNAPRTFTPGGTDQVNSLNDDDNLTGVGTNPTLNFTYVNDVDSGDNYILPTMTNVQTVNVAFAIDGAAQLDLEDSTGVKAVNISRISGQAPLAGIVNMTSIPTLSITNSQAPTGNVQLQFLQSTVAGAADATTLTLSNVNIGGTLFIEQTGAGAGLTDGIETLTIVSTGSANKIGVLEAEDLQKLILTGGQKLTLGTTGTVVNTAVGGAGLIEATRYGAGLNNVAGSLTVIDASAMTASLDIAIGVEANTTIDDTSGTPLNLKVTGTAQNDFIRLINGVNPTVGATIDGGAGTDTVQVFASVTKGSYTNLEALDVRAGQDAGSAADAINIDTSLFGQLATINLRNEGMDLNGAGAFVPSANLGTAEAAVFTLTKLTATTAAAITVQHSTTGNNSLPGAAPLPNALGLGGTTIVATLATDTASDTVGVTIANGVNNDPRFNFTLTAGTAAAPGGTNPVENVTINDSDTESNTVLLTNAAVHTGTITLTGGAAGTFLNLDSVQVTVAGAAGPPPVNTTSLSGAMRKDVTGLANDGKGWADFGAAAGDWIVASTIAAGGEASDVIVRVSNPAGPAGAQSITTGTGNDVVIFDAINGVGQGTAGLSISDTVAAGAGNDTLAIDGNGALINISASEWTNVSGFEQLRLIGNGGGVGNAGALGTNQYNITLTNAFITANNTTTGGVSRIAIHNDNDPANDVIGTANTAGTGVESGVTIDARQLDATHSFSYNGEEGTAGNVTNDRFIMSDANINGSAIIDGGAILGGGNTASNTANNDIFEVRDAAVVTVGDLAGVSNVATLLFTNDTATTQSSILQLDDATVDRLVNSTKAAAAGFVETLTIQAIDNPILPAATTSLTMDTTGLTSSFLALNVTGGGGADILAGGGSADTLVGGAGNDTITAGGGADVITGGTGADVINLTEATQAADQVRFNPGDGGLSFPSGTFAGFDTVTGFNADFDIVAVNGAATAVELGGVPAPQTPGSTFTNVLSGAFSAAGAVGGAFMSATVVDLTNGADVSVTGIGFITFEAAGDQAYFAVRNTAGTQVAIYHYVENTNDNFAGATELEMVGLINYTGTLTASDITFF